MEDTYLHRALYVEAVTKLQHTSRVRTFEEDETWEDFLALQSFDSLGPEGAKHALNSFRDFPTTFRIHAAGRIGQLATPDNPLQEPARRHLRTLHNYARSEQGDEAHFANLFIYPLAQAYARVDSLEGIKNTAHLADNDARRLRVYARAAKIIGNACSEASLDIAEELTPLAAPLAASAISNAKVSSHHVAAMGDVLCGSLKRLYRSDPEKALQQAQTSDEGALNLLKAIQQLDEIPPVELYDQVLSYSKQPKTNRTTREHILRLFIQGGQYDRALEVPTGSSVSRRLSSRENPRKEAYLLSLYEQGNFKKAHKLIDDRIEDGPDIARLRDALIANGDVGALRKYNLSDNGYRPRTDEIQIHLRRGDMTAAQQVLAEMPMKDVASGYLTIAETLAADAYPGSYTIDELEGFCTGALIANSRTTSMMEAGWSHGGTLRKLFEKGRFEDASAFRQKVLQDSVLTAEDISSFHHATSSSQSRLLVRQGAYGEAMHGDHTDPTYGIYNTTALLGLVGALYPEVFRRTAQS